MSAILVTDHPALDVDLERAEADAAGAQLVVASTGDEKELLALAAQAVAILTCFKTVTAAVINAAPALKVVSRYGVGVDNIAVGAATARGIPVTNVPDYCVDEVAEHVIALLLTLRRKTAAYDSAVRSGNWSREVGVPIRRLAGSVLGVVGFGRIGRAVVQRAIGLGLEVLVAAPHASLREVRAAGAALKSVDELFEASDAITLHVPLTTETTHLVSRLRLAAMKPTAALINCSRGAVVDLDALATALEDGSIAGAALDVFAPEPLPHGHPLFSTPNTLLTPHVAYYSEESMVELRRRAIGNVVAVLSGRTPEHVVNGILGS